ncbi:MAG: phenylalanine--tRNA ligase subunit beta [Halobacteriovorax sp.]|nr:phenylalanine--tRNA ligase subunit beta [Halobacteriovorax sp.]|tara:strand:- start:16084 stop:18495 length:2412 start_codon:yes stop_codon:yes gene_type:complete
MLISTEWISDFVDLPDVSPKDLGVRFTLGTAEVEDVIESGEYLKKIKIAEIVSIEKHPEADKLNLVTFNFGGKENARVVCGASNVRVGLKTHYAPIGTTLPIGFTLEPKKIRGILSEGMLCSEEELGLSESSEGICDLPQESVVGTTLGEYLKETSDVLLDVDNKSLTHRPDLWGHYGIAREFAALYECDLKNPFDEKWKQVLEATFSNDASPITPKIEEGTSCTAYWGLSLSGVKVGPSPTWMQRRLKAVGLRPINNIVDISNYVMTELGMPNHIFDRDEIEDSKIIIKLSEKEKFVTLDEQERDLLPTDTVIADGKKTLVLAGIMGGLNSGVTEKTENIFIEVANWKPALVRRTSTRLGLRSDSSQRFEKTLDSQLTYRTLLRILELVKELCPEAKVIGKPEYAGEDLNSFEPLQLNIKASHISKVLGKSLDQPKIVSILSRLDFKVTENGDDLTVLVPSYRSTKDIDCGADLIEEIGRVIGYDNITPEGPKLSVEPVRLSEAQKLHRKIRTFLSMNAEAFEVMTYPLVGEKLLKKADWPADSSLKILNSISKDHDRMRDSLIPTLLEAASKNAKNYEEFKCFELGRVYPDFEKEHSVLAVMYYSKNKSPFLKLLNTMERLCQALSLPGEIIDKHPKFKSLAVNEDWSGLHPFEFKNIRIMGKPHGSIFSIHPLLLKNNKIKGQLSMALLDLSSFEGRAIKDKTKYHPLPKFPEATFDYTLDVESGIEAAKLLEPLKKLKIKEIVSHKIVDVYAHASDRKSVTLRSTFLDPDKTLDGELIKASEVAIIGALESAGYLLKQG